MELLASIAVPLLVLILGGIGWLYRHEKERRLQIEKQLSDKKYDVYIKLLTVFFDILKQVKKGQKTNATKLIDRMMDIKKELIIFGNDGVLFAFFRWEKQSQTKSNLKALAELIIEVRKDMGNPKTKISTKDFLKSLVQTDQDYKELKEQGYELD
jgi:predicted DNA-binding ribbon-helix-helix protein